MTDVFARLEELSAYLNASSDQLNSLIAQTEKKLADLRLGVHVWLKTPIKKEVEENANGELDDEITTWFGYTKCRGSWHLVVKTDSERWGTAEEMAINLKETSPYTPLHEAPRELRILALKHLPDLLRELADEAEKALVAVEEAKKIVSST